MRVTLYRRSSNVLYFYRRSFGVKGKYIDHCNMLTKFSTVLLLVLMLVCTTHTLEVMKYDSRLRGLAARARPIPAWFSRERRVQYASPGIKRV